MMPGVSGASLLPEIGLPPGEPEGLRQAARTYEASAERIGQLARTVRGRANGVAGGDWSGVAAGVFRAEAERIAADHDTAVGKLQDGSVALSTYARKLEEAQQLAKRAQTMAAEHDSAAASLNAQVSAAAVNPEPDPQLEAHLQAVSDQLAVDRSQTVGLSEQASALAASAAHQAGSAFSAIAQAFVGKVWKESAVVITPKVAADSMLFFRREMQKYAAYRKMLQQRSLAPGGLAKRKVWLNYREEVARIGQKAHSLDDYPIRWIPTPQALSKFEPWLRAFGKYAGPASAAVFGAWQVTAPPAGGTPEWLDRVVGGISIGAASLLAAVAVGLAAPVWAPIAAGVLAGAALYSLGNLAYKHREAIWGFTKGFGRGVWNTLKGVPAGLGKVAHGLGKGAQLLGEAGRTTRTLAGSYVRDGLDAVRDATDWIPVRPRESLTFLKTVFGVVT